MSDNVTPIDSLNEPLQPVSHSVVTGDIIKNDNPNLYLVTALNSIGDSKSGLFYAPVVGWVNRPYVEEEHGPMIEPVTSDLLMGSSKMDDAVLFDSSTGCWGDGMAHGNSEEQMRAYLFQDVAD